MRGTKAKQIRRIVKMMKEENNMTDQAAKTAYKRIKRAYTRSKVDV